MNLGAPLAGYGIALEPLGAAHLDELAPGLDPSCWQWTPMEPGPLPSTPAEHRRWLDKWYAIANEGVALRGDHVFCVRRLSDRALVGSTRYIMVTPAHRRLEIGWTFYRADARGTTVNPACKRLLLGRAFEEARCVRVELKCDARNARSRAAIKKLGAREEGTFRRHIILGDGYIRDSAYFSVLDDEWPDVRARLDARLEGQG
jgi:RimJ/RimL family protein N-acetyltransferase